LIIEYFYILVSEVSAIDMCNMRVYPGKDYLIWVFYYPNVLKKCHTKPVKQCDISYMHMSAAHILTPRPLCCMQFMV